SDVALHLYGHDLAELRQTADRLVRVLRSVNGAKDVHAEQIAGLDSLTITVDRQAVARAGVDARAIADAVSAVGGVDGRELVNKNPGFPIRVRPAPEARRDGEAIGSIPIRDERGNLVPLAQLARVEQSPGPSQISRQRLQRRITIQAN